ncbi:poly(A) polymerase [Synechococcus sp. Minos11]|uniref:CCA tRNA nucleotidyltransferase n=1 Tax=Synechococcus sp. Minos11 TaxID=221341 RepID=UPI001647595C|nr:CCA tRNA nucleotidyltransferase [Synechococcus sp. Minos11]QNJ07658.1 poly(A) polymerase [Synechococcus sp. Minos11]
MDWLATIAMAHGLHLSVVGGAVRDRLLGKSTPDKDLDLVVEGDGSWSWPAIQLLELIENHELPRGFQLKQSQSFEAFGTAQLHLQTPEGPLLCDLSSARSERYAFPGAHPEVKPADLLNDLKRRDFSINAIAERLPLSSNPLLDPFAGEADLKAGQLKLLHPLSLEDDPSRLLRGVRYGTRLGLELAAETTAQVDSTLAAWPWTNDAPALASRSRMELELLLSESCWRSAVELLESWRGLELIQRGWKALPPRSSAWLQRLGQWGHAIDPNWSAEELRLVGLLWLVPHQYNLVAIAKRLQLAHRQQQLLSRGLELQRWLEGLSPQNTDAWKASDWTFALEERGAKTEPLMVLMPLGPSRHLQFRRPLLRWLMCWRLIESPLSAKELMNQGLSAGPKLGSRLKELRGQAINQHA